MQEDRLMKVRRLPMQSVSGVANRRWTTSGGVALALAAALALGCQSAEQARVQPRTPASAPPATAPPVTGVSVGGNAGEESPSAAEQSRAQSEAVHISYEANDASIRDVVEHELQVDPAVPFDDIDVETADGIVSLEGEVDSILAKERATRLAQTVRGVRSVINKVKVEPGERIPDARLRLDVKRALDLDPATQAYAINVAAADGVVTLTGSLASWQQKQLAATVAKGVKGVKGVENEINVVYDEERADAQIREEIEGALRWNALVDDSMIDIAVKNGHVELSGLVGSAAEKSEAWGTSWVSGVESVDTDELEVARWARDPDLRKGKYANKSDQEIRTAILDTLAFDPRVAGFDVGVSVIGGVVTLRGIVDNQLARRAAESDARCTVGVRSVLNQLKVRPVEATDVVLATRVRQAFVLDPVVERYDLQVSAHENDIYLGGIVSSQYEKLRAQEVAEGVKGVAGVVNQIEVNPGPTLITHDPYLDATYMGPTATQVPARSDQGVPPDEALRLQVESELWWSPFVDEEGIDVTVEDGTVRLTGEVGSILERDLASVNAFQAGATWVRNDLVVVWE